MGLRTLLAQAARPALVVGAVGLVAAGLYLLAERPAGHVGDVGICSRDVLADIRQDARPFGTRAWRLADLELRGRMLADLGRSRALVGRPAAEVKGLLGPSECYLLQDGEPCYRVRVDGEPLYFVLPVARSGPRPWAVVRATLSKNLAPRGGCFFL